MDSPMTFEAAVQMPMTFEAAVQMAKQLPRASDVQKLLLYGYYKQATLGPPPTPYNPSSAFDVVAVKKWEAWDACRSLPRDAAQQKYVELVSSLSHDASPKPSSAPPMPPNGAPSTTDITQQQTLGPRSLAAVVFAFKLLQSADRGVLAGAPAEFGAFIERTTGGVDDQAIIFAWCASVYVVGTVSGCLASVAILLRHKQFDLELKPEQVTGT